MKLILLLTISTLIVSSINAAISSETQQITNDLDEQIAEQYKARKEHDGLSAAAEYFKAPQATKKIVKRKAKESFAATAEYFKAPTTNNFQIEALNLAQDRLAPAAEFQKTTQTPNRYSRTKVGNALATAAEYLQASESTHHRRRVDRVANSLAAAAEYLRVPELANRTSRTKVGNALAAASVYLKASEPRHHHRRVDRVADSLAATAEYLTVPVYPQRVGRTESENARVRNKRAATSFRLHFNARRRKYSSFGGPFLRPTTKAPRRRHHRPGVM